MTFFGFFYPIVLEKCHGFKTILVILRSKSLGYGVKKGVSSEQNIARQFLYFNRCMQLCDHTIPNENFNCSLIRCSNEMKPLDT